MTDNSINTHNFFDSYYIEQLHLRHCKALDDSETAEGVIEQGLECVKFTLRYKGAIGWKEWVDENMDLNKLEKIYERATNEYISELIKEGR